MTAPAQSASGRPAPATTPPPWLWLALGFVLLLLLTWLIAAFDLDRRLAARFYTPATGWFLGKHQPWRWLHDYGTIPGLVLTLGCLLGWLASFYRSGLRAWRKPCLVVVLTTALAAGLLVNAVLKQYWGRPRPSQTVEFGGQWDYRPIFPPGTPGKGASFPCGHCTMGFVFLATAAFYRRSRPLAVAGVTTGVVLGGLLSAARIVQGSHFLSDTLWACGIVGLTAAALILYLPEPRPQPATSPPRQRRWLLTAGVLVAVLATTGGFLTRRPFYRTHSYALTLPAGVDAIDLHMQDEPERVRLRSVAGPASLRVDAHGFGWVSFHYRQELAQQRVGNTLHLRVTVHPKSYFAELDHDVTLNLPATVDTSIRLLLNDHPIHP